MISKVTYSADDLVDVWLVILGSPVVVSAGWLMDRMVTYRKWACMQQCNERTSSESHRCWKRSHTHTHTHTHTRTPGIANWHHLPARGHSIPQSLSAGELLCQRCGSDAFARVMPSHQSAIFFFAEQTKALKNLKIPLQTIWDEWDRSHAGCITHHPTCCTPLPLDARLSHSPQLWITWLSPQLLLFLTDHSPFINVSRWVHD